MQKLVLPLVLAVIVTGSYDFDYEPDEDMFASQQDAECAGLSEQEDDAHPDSAAEAAEAGDGASQAGESDAAEQRRARRRAKRRTWPCSAGQKDFIRQCRAASDSNPQELTSKGWVVV